MRVNIVRRLTVRFVRESTLMPWTPSYYPAAMRSLPEPVREKAIEIANALLREGMTDRSAIRIAPVKAREWAERRSPAG